MRRQAIPLSREIARDLPQYTVHDESHIDALWKMAEVIGGDKCHLNPIEGFLFGGAALCHDLALSSASYPGGIDEIRRLPIYTEGLALLYPNGAFADLSIEQQQKLDAWAIRENHAPQAARLASQKWTNPIDGTEHHLIEDAQLRLFFSHRIGVLAESHWWPLSRVIKELADRPGPPGGMPQEWQIDEFKIAALLRASDASHIDHQRAPSFLFALKHLAYPSADHWLFQNLLGTPTVRGGRLRYSASRPFKQEEADAWWLCYDTINMIDEELSTIDRYLEDQRPEDRFVAQGIFGAHNPEELERAIRVEGWIPADARPAIGDVTSLIERLGGAQLYGNADLVPLRELLQNAIDATRALTCESAEMDAVALIACRLDVENNRSILSVSDNGIGMTQDEILGALLDFGTSLWRSSDLLRKHHPRLLKNQFNAIGEHGIGFFSVFTWSTEVKVVTRAHDSRREDTLVLEFRRGLQSRPILRHAVVSELRDLPGTTVSLVIDRERVLAVHDRFERRTVSLPEAVRRLLPFPPIRVVVAEKGSTEDIAPVDWKTAEPKDVLQYFGFRLTKASRRRSLLTDVREADGRIVGRAMYIPRIYSTERALVVGASGLRVGSVRECIGVFIGESRKAARDAYTVSASGNALRRWAIEQVSLVGPTLSREAQLKFADLVHSLGADFGDLCVARSALGVVNISEIKSWAMDREFVAIGSSVFDDREGDPTVIEDNALFVDFNSRDFRASLEFDLDREEAELPESTMLVTPIASAILDSWRVAGYTKAAALSDREALRYTFAHYELSEVPLEDTPDVVIVRGPRRGVR